MPHTPAELDAKLVLIRNVVRAEALMAELGLPEAKVIEVNSKLKTYREGLEALLP